jgi:tetratricopeptide (TPR) repeat protein
MAKKDLKKPDEFFTLSERVINWVRDNQKKAIAIGCCLAVAIVIAIIGRMVYVSNRNTKRIAFQEASYTAAAGKSDQAIEAFNKFLAKYSGSDLAPLARLRLARLYYTKGEYDKAVEQYEKAIPHLKGYSDFYPLAVLGVSAAYQSRGDKEKAVKDLLTIKDQPTNYLNEETLLQLTLLYHELGDAEKAKSAGEELMKKFPATSYAGLVKSTVGLD